MQPNDLASEVQRSPNLPAVSASTRSPGEVRFETEASMKPVPDADSTSTSFFVPMNSLRSARTRVKRARKSAVGWCAVYEDIGVCGCGSWGSGPGVKGGVVFL